MRRLVLELSPEVDGELSKLADRYGIPVIDVIPHALSLFKEYAAQEENGGALFTASRAGRLRSQVILPISCSIRNHRRRQLVDTAIVGKAMTAEKPDLLPDTAEIPTPVSST